MATINLHMCMECILVSSILCIGSSLLDRTLEDVSLQEVKSLLQQVSECIFKIHICIDKFVRSPKS